MNSGDKIGKVPNVNVAKNKMDLKEFYEEGYLQEVNRLFFHPLGLALTVEKHQDGTYKLGYIIDEREDPEGFIFQDISEEKEVSRGEKIDKLREEKAKARRKKFGWAVQPLGDKQE